MDIEKSAIALAALSDSLDANAERCANALESQAEAIKAGYQVCTIAALPGPSTLERIAEAFEAIADTLVYQWGRPA